MFTTLTCTDVRQTLDQFRRSVDQMFDNFYGYSSQPAVSSGLGDRNWSFSPVLESGWNDHQLRLRAILPGVAQSDVHVSVQNNQLVIEGERRAPEGFEKNASRQLAYGKFQTAVTLPTGLNTEAISCNLQNGVLDVVIPVSESSKPRQIQINTSGEQKSLSS